MGNLIGESNNCCRLVAEVTLKTQMKQRLETWFEWQMKLQPPANIFQYTVKTSVETDKIFQYKNICWMHAIESYIFQIHIQIWKHMLNNKANQATASIHAIGNVQIEYLHISLDEK